MPEPVSYATYTLDYPIFDAEFDPLGRPYLLVGGGGGENKGGVPNRLNCLDVSSRAEIKEAASIDLSREEDSVQSLASLAVKDGLITFTGINTSSASQRAGKNEHFRSFSISYKDSKRRSKGPSQSSNGSINPLSRASLFKSATTTSTKKKDAYQRITKLSPPQESPTSPSKRIGAIATGLAPSGENEIVLFDATTSIPSSSSIIARIPLKGDTEANDLDFLSSERSKPTSDQQEFLFTYCTSETVYTTSFNYNFSTQSLTKPSTTLSPSPIYSIPQSPGKSSPTIRFARNLTPHHIILLQNNPSSKGSQLLILHHPTSRIIQRHTLPRTIRSGISLAICPLDADPISDDRQLLIAVSATDSLVQLLTINHRPTYTDPTKQLTPLSPYQLLENPSCRNITKIAFSRFIPPLQPASSTSSIATKTQYIQLALVTIGGTVVVDTLPLTSVPTSPDLSASATPAKLKSKGTERPAVRWVLSSPGTERMRTWSGLLLIGFMILVSSVLLQGYLNPDAQANSRFAKAMRDVREHLQPPAAASLHPRPAYSSVQSAVSSATSSSIPAKEAEASETSLSISEALSDASSTYSVVTEALAANPSRNPEPSQHLRSLLSARHERTSQQGEQNQDDSEPDTVLPLLDSQDGANAETHHILLQPRSPSSATSDEEDKDQEHDLDISLHHPSSHSALTSPDSELRARPFESLHETERALWKKRLLRAGVWAEEQGEAVLRGVLVSEVVGAVGGAVREAVLGG